MRSIFDLDFTGKRVCLDGHLLTKFELAEFLHRLPGCFDRFLSYYIYNNFYSYDEIRTEALNYRNSF